MNLANKQVKEAKSEITKLNEEIKKDKRLLHSQEIMLKEMAKREMLLRFFNVFFLVSFLLTRFGFVTPFCAGAHFLACSLEEEKSASLNRHAY